MKRIFSGITTFLFIFMVGTGVFLFGFKNSDKPINQSEKTMSTIITTDKHYTIIKIKEKALINTPAISQYPELARGCEVTSLSMLLQTAGVKVGKMTLAEQLIKDQSKRVIKDGKIYFGNPNEGFVGDMYSYNKPGYGVYVQPILKLAEQYLPEKTVDLTNHSFEDLKIHLSDDRPVWVIINTQYKELPHSYFKTWYTKDGSIRVTRKEHSVLITGYDKKYVYFIDPLTGEQNKKAPINDFKKAWVQMGSQAITYLK